MSDQADAEFRDFMAARWPGLVRLSYGLTGDQALAEDLAQTALVKAYAAWPRVRRADSPDAYVRRIVINTNSSRMRSRRFSEHLMPSLHRHRRLHHGVRAGEGRSDTGHGQAGRRPAAGAAPGPHRRSAVGGVPRPGRDGGAPGDRLAGRAELGHAIPFTNPAGPSNLPSITDWLAPGAAGHPRVTIRLGSGIEEYAGPWGRCFTVASSPSSWACNPGFGPELRSGQSVSVLIRPPSGRGPGTYLATAGTQVSHVMVRLSGGQVLRPSIIAGADGEKFFTFTVGQGQRVLRMATSPGLPPDRRVTPGLPLAAGPEPALGPPA